MKKENSPLNRNAGCTECTSMCVCVCVIFELQQTIVMEKCFPSSSSVASPMKQYVQTMGKWQMFNVWRAHLQCSKCTHTHTKQKVDGKQQERMKWLQVLSFKIYAVSLVVV